MCLIPLLSRVQLHSQPHEGSGKSHPFHCGDARPATDASATHGRCQSRATNRRAAETRRSRQQRASVGQAVSRSWPSLRPPASARRRTQRESRPGSRTPPRIAASRSRTYRPSRWTDIFCPAHCAPTAAITSGITTRKISVEGTTCFQPVIPPATRTPTVAPPKVRVCCAAPSASEMLPRWSRHSSCAVDTQAGGAWLLVSASGIGRWKNLTFHDRFHPLHSDPFSLATWVTFAHAGPHRRYLPEHALPMGDRLQRMTSCRLLFTIHSGVVGVELRYSLVGLERRTPERPDSCSARHTAAECWWRSRYWASSRWAV